MLDKVRMDELEDIADKARLKLTVHDQFPVPMKTVLQRIPDASAKRKIHVKVAEEGLSMDQALTYFDKEKAVIVLSKETASEVGTASRANFTLAHELGHALLHDGKRAFARSRSGKDYRAQGGVKNSSKFEAEANYFASAFLMPRSAIDANMTVDDMVSKFQVAKRTAEIRYAAISGK